MNNEEAATHYELIMKGLENNKHIFVEKPIVEDYEQIKECFDFSFFLQLFLYFGYLNDSSSFLNLYLKYRTSL